MTDVVNEQQSINPSFPYVFTHSFDQLSYTTNEIPGISINQFLERTNNDTAKRSFRRMSQQYSWCPPIIQRDATQPTVQAASTSQQQPLVFTSENSTVFMFRSNPHMDEVLNRLSKTINQHNTGIQYQTIKAIKPLKHESNVRLVKTSEDPQLVQDCYQTKNMNQNSANRVSDPAAVLAVHQTIKQFVTKMSDHAISSLINKISKNGHQ